MTRKLDTDKLVLATRNRGKIREIEELLKPYSIKVVCADELNLPEAKETGLTFAENAKIKALLAAKTSGLPALADDSGLEIHALDGQPGIYSARRVENGDYYAAMEALYNQIKDKPFHTANFTCALVIAWPDGETETFEGKVFGTLCWPPQGVNGFGYDPFFIPDGFNKSFGALSKELKQRISHRARALAKFSANCL